MGEAKRRKELGLPARQKVKNFEESERFISWLPLTKNDISRYPYAAPVTMAIGLILLLIDWSKFNNGI